MSYCLVAFTVCVCVVMGCSYGGVVGTVVLLLMFVFLFPSQSFWVFIDPLVPDEIRMQLLALRNADSDIMKCRSWVRLMLSKSVMLNFLEDLQRHPGLLASHYGGEAVIRDTERFEVIIQLMKGISLFQFDSDYTSTRLEGWDKDVLRLAGIWEPPEGNSGKGSSAQMKSPCTCDVCV